MSDTKPAAQAERVIEEQLADIRGGRIHLGDVEAEGALLIVFQEKATASCTVLPAKTGEKELKGPTVEEELEQEAKQSAERPVAAGDCPAGTVETQLSALEKAGRWTVDLVGLGHIERLPNKCVPTNRIKPR